MKILNFADYTNHLNEMAAKKRVAEEVADFFRMFDTRKGTIAWVYYGNNLTQYMPKYVKLNGVKQPNPMLGRIFKISAYKFKMGREYYENLEKKVPGYSLDPNAPINQENRRPPVWDRLPEPAAPCAQNIKTGEVGLPIVEPKTAWSKWIMIDDTGKPVEVEYADVQPYLKASKSSSRDYKMLYVNKIYKFNAGGKSWTNKDTFLYPILVPFFGK
jgi:hypothetical protein